MEQRSLSSVRKFVKSFQLAQANLPLSALYPPRDIKAKFKKFTFMSSFASMAKFIVKFFCKETGVLSLKLSTKMVAA
jgi:hypothetical protein